MMKVINQQIDDQIAQSRELTEELELFEFSLRFSVPDEEELQQDVFCLAG
jgi:hypothetical protein